MEENQYIMTTSLDEKEGRLPRIGVYKSLKMAMQKAQILFKDQYDPNNPNKLVTVTVTDGKRVITQPLRHKK
ncbi:MAG: hypothetical protein F4X93_02290 [Proteobacteria bacterium]|nr:hypothetical protein [Pseudomonadota bacterium]